MIKAPIGERQWVGGRQRIAAKKGPSEAIPWVEFGIQPTKGRCFGTTRLPVVRWVPINRWGLRGEKTVGLLHNALGRAEGELDAQNMACRMLASGPHRSNTLSASIEHRYRSTWRRYAAKASQ